MLTFLHPPFLQGSPSLIWLSAPLLNEFDVGAEEWLGALLSMVFWKDGDAFGAMVVSGVADQLGRGAEGLRGSGVASLLLLLCSAICSSKLRSSETNNNDLLDKYNIVYNIDIKTRSY